MKYQFGPVGVTVPLCCVDSDLKTTVERERVTSCCLSRRLVIHIPGLQPWSSYHKCTQFNEHFSLNEFSKKNTLNIPKKDNIAFSFSSYVPNK